jgi:putative copper resistance protein D
MTPDLLVRIVHLTGTLSLVGLFTAWLLAGRSDRPTVRAWDRQVVSLMRWLLAIVLVSGLGVLALQAALATGRPGAALEPGAWWNLLTRSQFGSVWLVRLGGITLLGAFMLLAEREHSAADWLALRVEGIVLAAVGAGAIAWAGHAAAVEPGGALALGVDALHVVAAGAWFGALPPLALLVRRAATVAGADARPIAVLAMRRFSALALVLMTVVPLTGIYNAWVHVGGIAPLVGTTYGWLLSAKVLLLVAVAALAVRNRRRLLPALSGDGPTVGRPAMARLARFMAWEAGLAVLIVAITAGLGLTPPARHVSPWWPFTVRLSYEASADVPGVAARLFIGSQVAVLGLVAAVAGAVMRAARWPLIGLGGVLAAAGLWIALPPLAVDAYPTTYLRSSVPYQAVSIAHGHTLYREHCEGCHGPGGRGDGAGAAGLARRPADLTAPHTSQHTAGDLFWWLTHGIPRAGMPGFGDRLTVEDRWDLVNFLRALAIGEQARALGLVEPGRPWLVAPDASFAVGPTPERALKSFRDRAMVLLVLFSLPDSRERLVQLAEAYSVLQGLGAEILAVPTDADPAILTRLGANPPILFPVATEGAADIVAAYALLGRALTPESLGSLAVPPRHAEFLIDRQGYVRGRFIPGGGLPAWRDTRTLLDQVRNLAREAPTAPAPDEHVH